MSQSLLPQVAIPSFATSTFHNKRLACDRCRSQKLRCPRPSQSSSQDGLEEPCVRCQRAGKVCIYGQRVKSGRPPKGSKDKSYLSKDFGRIDPRTVQEQITSEHVETEYGSLSSDDQAASFLLGCQTLTLAGSCFRANEVTAGSEGSIANHVQSQSSLLNTTDDLMSDASSFPYTNMENFPHEIDHSDAEIELAKLNDGEYELSIDPDFNMDWGSLMGNATRLDRQKPLNLPDLSCFQRLFELHMKLLNWIKAYKPTLQGEEFNLLRDGETAANLVDFSGEFIDVCQKSLPFLLNKAGSFQEDILSKDVDGSTGSSPTLDGRNTGFSIPSYGVLFSMISCYTQLLNVFEVVLEWQRSGHGRRVSDVNPMPAVGKMALKASIIIHTIKSFFLHLNELSSTYELTMIDNIDVRSKLGGNISLRGLSDWESIFPYEIDTRSILGSEICGVKVQEDRIFAEIYRLENS